MIFSGIASVVGAISGFIGGLGAIGSFLLRTAVGIGLNLLAQSLAGKPKEPTFSLNGELRGGGDLPRSFIIGKYMTAGSLAFATTFGQDGDTPNAWLVQVIALSDLPSKGLLEVYVDGKKVTYGAGANTDRGYSIPEYEKNGPNLYIKFYDGTQTVADPFLVANVNTTEKPYTNKRVGRGVAYAIVYARSTKNMFSGIPAFQFVVDGTRLYDISKDTTAGGSGSHRWADPATWGGDGDENPVVQAYNIFRGISYGGKWLYGLQNTAAQRLPAANWIAAINKARATIPAAGGKAEATYRSSGEIEVDVPPVTAIETILTTCQGRICETGGFYTIFIGAPGAAVVHITDDDIISTTGQTFTPFMGIAESINGVHASYPNPGDAWNVATAPPLLRADLEARDGGRRLLADIELTFVPYPEQVQRLMKSALEEAQRFRRHTITLPPEFWPYAVPGVVWSWTSKRNGYVTKLMRIDGVVDRADLEVMIDITEVDPSDYDWNSGVDFKPPVDGDLGLVRPQPQPIVGWSVTASEVTDNAGVARRPAILLAWANQPARLLDVVGIRFQVRNVGTGKIEYRGLAPDPAAGSLLYSQGLLPNTDYEVQGVYVLSSEREVIDSGWLPVRTKNILLTGDDVYLPGMVEGLQEFVADATEWIRDGTRQVILEQERLARLTIDQDFGSFTARQTIKQEIIVESGRAKAYALQQIDVATNDQSALARRIEVLRAEVATKADGPATAASLAALTSRVTVTENAIEVISQDIVALNASLGTKADASALQTLTARVTVNEGKITTQAGQITSLQTAIAGKADASAVNLLTTKVEEVELTANGKNRVYKQASYPAASAVGDLLIKTNDKNRIYRATVANSTAAASWSLSEDQRVPELITTTLAQADAITAISAGSTTGDIATANFRMGVSGSPATGFASRIGLEARTGGAGGWRNAALFLDVPTSTSLPTRVTIIADRFELTDGSTNAKPFIFSGGVARLNVAHIGLVQAGILESQNGKMTINLNNGTIEIFS